MSGDHYPEPGHDPDHVPDRFWCWDTWECPQWRRGSLRSFPVWSVDESFPLSNPHDD